LCRPQAASVDVCYAPRKSLALKDKIAAG